MDKTYEHLSEMKVAELCINDIRWLGGTGRACSSGTGQSKKTSYRRGVSTPLGDIEQSVWYQVAEAIIRRDGGQQLLSQLVEWESEHNYVHMSVAEIRQKALKLFSVGIFKNPRWVHYIPFNRRFHPEVLLEAHIVTIISACCQMPGEVTQEQIDAAYSNMVACPHCGRWAAYTVAETQEPWETD